MLKHPVLSRRRTFATSLGALCLVATSGLAAWAAQPAGPGTARSAPGAVAATDQPAVALENMPPPRYPVEAAQSGVTGQVILIVSVAADGSVTDVEVERATPAGVFDAGTVEAARQWKFTPAMENGKAVPGRVRVPVTFALDPPEQDGAAEGGQA